MKNIAKIISFPFLLITCLFIFGVTVSAQSVSYRTYKYGTHQTSMADGYYARPAQVVVDDNQYLVTMTIRTNNLKRDISSQIKIDVPHVYQATHNITFAFDTTQLPKLTNKKERVSHAESAIKRSAPQVKNKSVKPKEQLAQKKQAAIANRQIAHNARNQRANQQRQRNFYYVILAGVLSSLILIGVAVLIVVNAKERKSK